MMTTTMKLWALAMLGCDEERREGGQHSENSSRLLQGRERIGLPQH